MDNQRRKYRLPSGTVISVSIVNLSTVQENWVPLDETKPPAPIPAETQTVEAEKKPAPARKRTSRKPAAK